MLKAIEILEKGIETSKSMKKFYEDALEKMNYVTADGMVITEYKYKLVHENQNIIDCLEAIQILKQKLS